MPDSYRIIYSPKVVSELEAIHDYIAQDSPQNARGMIDRILSSVDSLLTFPHRNLASHQHPGMAHPVRSLPVPPYVVFFRIVQKDHVVRILRIRHGAQRPLKRFE